jgi:hypothetical protein
MQIETLRPHNGEDVMVQDSRIPSIIALIATVTYTLIGLVLEAPASPAPLKPHLDKIWATYVYAVREGDMAIFKATCSAHSYAVMENAMASASKSVSQKDLTDMADFLPDLSKYRFAKIIRDGPTAGMVYIDAAQVDGDPNMPPPVSFVFIKFVEEASGWKVDGVLTIRKPRYQRDGSETGFEISDIPKSLAIDGKLHQVPSPIIKAEVSGMIDISSYGYKTEVTINGIKQGSTQDSTSSGYINGGLKKGKNDINIVFTPIEGSGAAWEPSVKIRYLSSTEQVIEAFAFEPKKLIKGLHSFTFMIGE